MDQRGCTTGVFILFQVNNRDICALTRECYGRDPSDTRIPARYDRNAASKASASSEFRILKNRRRIPSKPRTSSPVERVR